MKSLDKTSFLHYTTCPRYGWHKFNDKVAEELDNEQQYLVSIGQQIEYMAHGLFPDGYEITGNNQKASELTRNLINNSDVDVIYQATALSPDNLLAKADIVTIDKEDQTINIYEV